MRRRIIKFEAGPRGELGAGDPDCLSCRWARGRGGPNGEKSGRKEETASPSESKVKRGGREELAVEEERGDEQKTRKRIGEHRYMRTREKRRAGKSERVQLPTGNGKQTKRGKRGKGRGARTSWKRVSEKDRKRDRRAGGSREKRRGEGAGVETRGKPEERERWNRRNAVTRMLHRASEEDEDAAVGG